MHAGCDGGAAGSGSNGGADGSAGGSSSSLRVSVPFAERGTIGAVSSAPPMPESATLYCDVPHEQQQARLSEPHGYGKRVTAIVRAAASTLQQWAGEVPEQLISQLTGRPPLPPRSHLMQRLRSHGSWHGKNVKFVLRAAIPRRTSLRSAG